MSWKMFVLENVVKMFVLERIAHRYSVLILKCLSWKMFVANVLENVCRKCLGKCLSQMSWKMFVLENVVKMFVFERIAHRYSVLILNSSDRVDTPSWNLVEGCGERMPGYLSKKKKKTPL